MAVVCVGWGGEGEEKGPLEEGGERGHCCFLAIEVEGGSGWIVVVVGGAWKKTERLCCISYKSPVKLKLGGSWSQTRQAR